MQGDDIHLAPLITFDYLCADVYRFPVYKTVITVYYDYEIICAHLCSQLQDYVPALLPKETRAHQRGYVCKAGRTMYPTQNLHLTL